MKTALLRLQVQIHSINTYKNAPYWKKVTNKKDIKLEEIGKKNLEKRQKVAKICSDLLDFL